MPDLHTRTMDIVASAGRLLLMLGDDLDIAQRNVERAETLGPILDPTAYWHGADNLDDQRRVLRAAVALRDACRAVRGKESEE